MSKQKNEKQTQDSVPHRETVAEKPEFKLQVLRDKVASIGNGQSVKEVLNDLITEVENLICKG